MDCPPGPLELDSNSVTRPRIWKVPCPAGSPAAPGCAAPAVGADADVVPGAAVTVTVGDGDPHPVRHPPTMAVVPAMAATRRQESVAFMLFSISDVATDGSELPMQPSVVYCRRCFP